MSLTFHTSKHDMHDSLQATSGGACYKAQKIGCLIIPYTYTQFKYIQIIPNLMMLLKTPKEYVHPSPCIGIVADRSCDAGMIQCGSQKARVTHAWRRFPSTAFF